MMYLEILIVNGFSDTLSLMRALFHSEEFLVFVQRNDMWTTLHSFI